MKRILLATASTAVLGLAACASYPVPQQHLADSFAAVRSAEENGAPTQPQAALNLKLAQEELARAKALADSGDNEQADFMAVRAKSDADLALALARENLARNRAMEGHAKAKAVEGGAQVMPLPPAEKVLPPTPSTTPPVHP